KVVSCAFTNNPQNQLEDIDTNHASEILASALNQFFSQCPQTQYLHETPPEDLSVEEVNEFRAKILLGRSVGLEILGRLLYNCYDSSRKEFQPEKITQLTQIDWSRNGMLWQGNVILPP
ncbi:DNA sulfur modification protein DndB, partial [Planococcus sp. SIMBA_160]